MVAPRFFYLHGFASTPTSKKALAFEAHFRAKGLTLTSLDLRVPTLERLSVSSMIATTRAAIGDDTDRAVLIGSSLGGLTAAYTAVTDARVCALVLLAPAFGLPSRWRRRLGDEGMRLWREHEWLPLPEDPDGPERLHYSYMEDALALEATLGAAPDVRVPTVVIHGRGDDVVPVEGSRAFCAQGPLRRLIEVEDEHALYGSIDVVTAAVDRLLF